ncbi:hypothetical protein [Ekhidna sp.]|uniref:hypothetical protein n=1 Tax=Ekhidna sp. TaxID=2608089 RepID=UPI0032EB1A17
MEEDKIKIKHLEQRVEILEFSMKRMKNQIEYLMEVAPPRKKSGKSKIDIDTWKEIFKSRNFFTREELIYEVFKCGYSRTTADKYILHDEMLGILKSEKNGRIKLYRLAQ